MCLKERPKRHRPFLYGSLDFHFWLMQVGCPNWTHRMFRAFCCGVNSNQVNSLALSPTRLDSLVSLSKVCFFGVLGDNPIRKTASSGLSGGPKAPWGCRVASQDSLVYTGPDLTGRPYRAPEGTSKLRAMRLGHFFRFEATGEANFTGEVG